MPVERREKIKESREIMIDVEIMEKIKKGINNRFQLCIRRDEFDENSLYAVPIKASENLLLFAYMYDFSFDGFKIIRLNDISSIRHDEQEIFAEEIYKKENLHIPEIETQINLENIKSLLTCVIKQNIIIECEKNEESFFIGRIVNLKENSLEFLGFDGIGVWEKETVEIKYDEITSITISGRYLNTISKYIRESD